MANITIIPAPRVPFIDERTNDISREWFLFLLNLFSRANTDDVFIEMLQLASHGQSHTSENSAESLAPPVQKAIEQSDFSTAPVPQYNNVASYDYVYVYKYVEAANVKCSESFSIEQTVETYPRYFIDNTGKIDWGSGSGAADASIYRIAANTLRLSDNLQVTQTYSGAGNIRLFDNLTDTYAKIVLGLGATALQFGPGGSTSNVDSSIKRSAVGECTISNDLVVFNKFGCNGKAAQGTYYVNGASSDLATVISLCNQIRTALIANGICT